MDILSELSNKRRINRRRFLAGVGAAGAATALAGCGGPAAYTAPTSTSTSYNDVDILNFALNLEYLEAEFYLRAATGSGLTTADAGTGAGTVVGGAQVTGLTTGQQNILNEIAFDEQAHVRFLRSALGSSAVARPNLDLTNSFNALASAAGIGSTFNPFADFNHFLVGAFVFEDVGVTAYSGAAPLDQHCGHCGGYLAAAAGILAVEAYHAAYVRTSLTAQAIGGYVDVSVSHYANQVSALRASLGGGNETTLTGSDGYGAVHATTIPTPSSIVAATTANAIAYARTTDQVLHIVYGTLSNTAGSTTLCRGRSKGGFFPNGLNGNITVTQS